MEFLSVSDCGAKGDGITDDTAAFLTCLAKAKTVRVPPGKYKTSSPLSVGSGQSLICDGAPNRWRSPASDCQITYTGSAEAVLLQPASTVVMDSVMLRGIQLDGLSAAGTADGILMSATAGSGAAIEGVLLDNVGVTNFPGYGVHAVGVVFDVTLRRLSWSDQARSSLGGVFFHYPGSGGAPSQITCDDCFLAASTNNT